MAELPHIGEHCGMDICHRLDFLPVRCDQCSSIFCIDHFTYEAHSCANAISKNVQVPVCPLCSKPVPTPKGISPDVQVNEHILNNCVMNKKEKIFKNRCSNSGCKKKELVPVLCVSCKRNFCFSHRHEKDHNCGGRPVPLAGKGGRSGQDCAKEIRHSQQLAADEALARSLAASMDDVTLSPEQRDRMLAEQLQREEYRPTGNSRREQSNSSNCVLS